MEFARRVNRLEVRIGGRVGGDLRRESQFRFTYAAQASQPVSLIMPLADREFVDNALFCGHGHEPARGLPAAADL